MIATMEPGPSLSPDALAAKLSQVLPQAIDKLTPGGAVPKA